MTERDLLRRIVAAWDSDAYISNADLFDAMYPLMPEARAILAQPAPDTLDAAWARVEAALPDGLYPQLEKYTPATYRGWAVNQTGERVLPCSFGSTPQAALHALADALESRK